MAAIPSRRAEGPPAAPPSTEPTPVPPTQVTPLPPAQRVTGERPALPPRLADLLHRTERVDGLTNDLEALKELIDDRMAAKTRRVRVRT